jgi:hypothetical protein
MFNFEADPQKYAELSKPFDSQEEAEHAAREFFNGVRALREQCRIPEVVLQFVIYVQGEGEVLSLSGGGGWGDQLKQAQIARRAADREFEHLGLLVRGIADAIPPAGDALITDPVATEETVATKKAASAGLGDSNEASEGSPASLS